MIRLPLRNRQGTVVAFATIDDVDAEQAQYRWHRNGNGYVTRTIYSGGGRKNPKLKTVYLHSQIIDVPEGFEIDHFDGNRLNNRRSNLRVATRALNQQNRSANKRGK